MFQTKLKMQAGIVIVVLASLSGLGGVAGMVYQAHGEGLPKAVNADELKKEKDNPSVAKDSQKPKDDHELIQGKWLVVSAEVGGKAVDELKGDVMIFDKDKYFISYAKRDDTESGKFQLDSSKKPKQIDIMTKGAGGKPTPGIYDFDGDKLKICIADDTKERPTKFATSPDRPTLGLLVLQRAKN